MHGGDVLSYTGHTLYQLVRILSSAMPRSLRASRTLSISSALATAASSAVSPRVSTPIVTETLSGVTFTVAVPDVETTEWTACPISCSQTSAPVSHLKSTGIGSSSEFCCACALGVWLPPTTLAATMPIASIPAIKANMFRLFVLLSDIFGLLYFDGIGKPRFQNGARQSVRRFRTTLMQSLVKGL